MVTIKKKKGKSEGMKVQREAEVVSSSNTISVSMFAKL